MTNNFYRSDLPNISHIVQNGQLVFPKEIVIATLREYFEMDSYYRYSRDAYGFANTPDATDLPPAAGLNDNVTTRLWIGENFHQNLIFYPALVVKHNGSTSVPISLNREYGSVKWGQRVYQDKLGNTKTFPVAESFIFAGAWEGSLAIDIYARSLTARDELAELISLLFVDVEYLNLQNAGLAIKGVQVSGASESDDRNDKLFKATVTLTIRSEWRRAIPIGNIIEVIQTSIEFGRVNPPVTPVSANLTINTNQTLVDLLNSL